MTPDEREQSPGEHLRGSLEEITDGTLIILQRDIPLKSKQKLKVRIAGYLDKGHCDRKFFAMNYMAHEMPQDRNSTFIGTFPQIRVPYDEISAYWYDRNNKFRPDWMVIQH